jgi:hypothetical protein
MLKDALSRLRQRVRDGIADIEQARALVRKDPAPLATPPDDPPVVARMIVEIRSDGLRTVARGAVEDVATGDRVAVEARGSTPAQLAASLAKSLFSMPLLARQAARALREARRAAPEADVRNGDND